MSKSQCYLFHAYGASSVATITFKNLECQSRINTTLKINLKMETHEVTKVSRKLSYILRHHPDEIGLTLDEQGWGSVDYILSKLKVSGIPLSMDVLKEVVETNDKKRFAFNADFSMIRANQGHSVEVELGYVAQEPPALLFHGTAQKSIQSIKGQGLVKGSRHHVHLSADETTAKKVGQRHGVPVVLKVKAGAMHEAGHAFFQSENGVWLTDLVPTQFIVFPQG
jgi:putative RNA 2'-phosphotransferase